MVASKKTGSAGSSWVVLPLLALIAALIVASVLLVLSCGGSTAEVQGNQDSNTATEAHPRTLADLPQAQFLSIFVYDANGNMSSFLVGGKTDQFREFATAVAEAKPVDIASDESYSDLLVFSFGGQDTMELSYSRKHNLFMLGDRAYEPSADLSPKIADVEAKFTY